MVRKSFSVVAVLGLVVLTVGPAAAQDARAVLQAASKAMGNLKSVQITGTGWNAAVGQSFTQEEDWPRFEVTRYVRTIDFEAGTSREEFTRRQGNNPPQGGGGTPLQGEQQQVFLVSGNSACNASSPPGTLSVLGRPTDRWPRITVPDAISSQPTPVAKR